jgi:hypothetical protein
MGALFLLSDAPMERVSPHGPLSPKAFSGYFELEGFRSEV